MPWCIFDRAALGPIVEAELLCALGRCLECRHNILRVLVGQFADVLQQSSDEAVGIHEVWQGMSIKHSMHKTAYSKRSHWSVC
jgi:hypothetical protein